MNKVTMILTSCGRQDLLERTLDSFWKLNTYPIEKIMITEDSENYSMRDFINNKYGDKVELFFNVPKLGLLGSLDLLYSKVETPYVYAGEDDWEMVGNNSNFISESIEILEERNDIHQIWIRKDVPKDWMESNVHKTSSGISFKMMGAEHCGNWNGFSWNPGIRRMSDFKKIFPQGFSAYKVEDQPLVLTEHACMMHTKKFNYRAAILNNPVCVHIGHGRTTL